MLFKHFITVYVLYNILTVQIRSQILTINGGIHYEQEDVFLNIDDDIKSEFLEKYTIIQVEIPILKCNNEIIGQHTIYDHESKFLVFFMAALGYEEYSVLGSGHGCPLALYMVARTILRIKKLVLWNLNSEVLQIRDEILNNSNVPIILIYFQSKENANISNNLIHKLNYGCIQRIENHEILGEKNTMIQVVQHFLNECIDIDQPSQEERTILSDALNVLANMVEF
ncbi:uncharacterized protein LOC126906639 isoform X2 [Daktulosphaira vitifoliae]|uniref:uncharacterized protein LOC126906639 isoform X2 n=1 Tax=Daktulosphaira vitifoliae TaxID=58002 RepID=UPI0021A9F9CC|nr:uncharacterized protein LOC126906639 isoform X2 [Daktulosphaira vitifoliae]